MYYGCEEWVHKCILIFFVVPSNRVISSPFSHKTFFFTILCKGIPYFFSGSKFIKKCFRCWHSQFWSWLTSKPLFFIFLQVTKLPSRTGSFSGFLSFPGVQTTLWSFYPRVFLPCGVCKWSSFKEFSQMARFPLFTDFFSNCDISRILYIDY